MALRRREEAGARDARGRAVTPAPRRYDPVPLARIPPSMRTAALIGEDHRFYEHGGIDYTAIRDAIGYRRDGFRWTDAQDRDELFRALSGVWRRRERIRGASTITQQLAKNLYLSPSRNPLRKLKEVITAWRLEYWLGKERILELYLNVVELGPEVWGVEAASRKYYGHPASGLSLEEAAGLAGTLPFPLRSNPGYRPGRMRWRQSMIARRMRGENVEVPPVLDTAPDSTADTTRAPPDTARDTTRLPPDTIPDTLRINRPDGGASPASYSWQGRPSPPARRSRRAPAP
jgi:monofunctional biosynthetic peptidoglycan transglycosylase